MERRAFAISFCFGSGNIIRFFQDPFAFDGQQFGISGTNADAVKFTFHSKLLYYNFAKT